MEGNRELKTYNLTFFYFFFRKVTPRAEHVAGYDGNFAYTQQVKVALTEIRIENYLSYLKYQPEIGEVTHEIGREMWLVCFIFEISVSH